MNELEPLSVDASALLRDAEAPEPPDGAQQRILARLRLDVPTAAPSSGSSMLGRWGAPLAVASLVVGLAAGAWLQDTFAAPKIETRVEVRVVEVERPPPVVPAPVTPEPIPSKAPERRKNVVDLALAQERQLIDQARSALVRGELEAAIDTLAQHRRAFANGRLAEERESLAIQTSIRAGDFAEARQAAERFRRQFPESMLLPAVEAALTSIPP